MITGATKNKVDDIWQKMWEGGITNPLEVISQLTYLMFIRSLDEKEFEIERMEGLLGEPKQHIFPQDAEGQRMRWNVFKDLEPEAMLEVVQGKVFPVLNIPQKIPFRQGSYVSSVLLSDQRNGRVSVMLHFFQSLSDRIRIIKISHLTFGCQKK